MASSRLGNPAWQDGVGSVLSRRAGTDVSSRQSLSIWLRKLPPDAMAAMARRLERKFAAEGG